MLIDMVRRVVTLLLASLLALAVVISLFLYVDNLELERQVTNLNDEIVVLKSANLTTALGVVEIPPYGESYWGGNGNTSYVWITGWVFNSGASMAKKAGLQVLALDQSNAVLMNYTVPIASGGIAAFSSNETKNPIPYYLYPTSLEFGNVLSQENVTVRMAIFHEGVFSNNTRSEVNPVWHNTP
jgi:hypothetical protein